MIAIRSVTERSSPGEIVAAQALFGQYAEFLRSISACHGFDFRRFAEETAALPEPYSRQGGELLLAMRQDDEASAEGEGSAVGCLGYRRATGALLASEESGQETSEEAEALSVCEIKRLFVSPQVRGQQLGRVLAREALDRAARRGYRTVVLDTEPSSMAAAYRTYTGLGFREFQPASASPGGPKVVYLRRTVP